MRILFVFALCVLAHGSLFAQGETFTPIPTRADGTGIYNSRKIILRPVSWTEELFTWDQLEDSELFYTLDQGASWRRSVIALNKWPEAGESPYFVFNAPSDGLYGFYYRRPDVAKPQDAGSIQSKAFIDTTSPWVQVQSPQEGNSYQKGEVVEIRYQSDDDNPDLAYGFSLDYSEDDGETWVPITTDQPVTGSYDWFPPQDKAAAIKLRIRIRDLVGEVGQVMVHNIVVARSEKILLSDKPAIKIVGPKLGKIYFENTDFYYEVANHTSSPTALVRIWFSMDNGQTWQFGGNNTSGQNNGKVQVYFPPGFRRHGAFGNYKKISFYYQVITADGLSNLPDPVAGISSPTDIYYVDTDSPKFALHQPAFGDSLYRGMIPNNQESGKYHISWDGADRNAIPFIEKPGYERGPVALYYSSNPEAAEPTWIMLSDRLPLNGSFIKFNDLPLGKCQIKAVATDEMGNQAIRFTGIFKVVDGTAYGEEYRSPDYGKNPKEVKRIWAEAQEHYQAGDYQSALRAYNNALELAAYEDRNAIEHDMALAFYKDGQTQKALQTLEDLIQAEDDNLTFRYSLASLYFQEGLRGDAKEQLEAILERDDNQPHMAARSLLAGIYWQEGLTKKAETLWRFILENASVRSSEYKDAQLQLAALEKNH